MHLQGEHSSRRGEQRFSKSGEHGMHPVGGSPAPKRCTAIALLRTASQRSVPKPINSTVGAGNKVTLRPVPLSLIPQTLSREIHTYNRGISEIGICRTGEHGYLITLTTRTPRGGLDAD